MTNVKKQDLQTQVDRIQFAILKFRYVNVKGENYYSYFPFEAKFGK